MKMAEQHNKLMTHPRIQREDAILDWLRKHIIELLLAAVLGLLTWELTLLIELKEEVAINSNNIAHINKAVNNVGADDKTLRTLIQETRNKVDILEERTQQRYK